MSDNDATIRVSFLMAAMFAYVSECLVIVE